MDSGLPLVGVTAGFTDYGDYIGIAYSRPLERIGAAAITLPYAESSRTRAELLRRVDALILGVGRDIEPIRYHGPPPRKATLHSPLRDEFELRLAVEALEAGAPVLGICRGLQVLNVACGGTLYGDSSE